MQTYTSKNLRQRIALWLLGIGKDEIMLTFPKEGQKTTFTITCGGGEFSIATDAPVGGGGAHKFESKPVFVLPGNGRDGCAVSPVALGGAGGSGMSSAGFDPRGFRFSEGGISGSAGGSAQA